MTSMLNKESKGLGIVRDPFWIGLVLVFILAFVFHVFSTQNWGVGVSHDSIFYLSSAENFLKGEGISRIGGGNAVKPLTHFPPLYPLSLSFLGFFLGDVNQAANWIASTFFAINTALIMFLTYLGLKSLKASYFSVLIFMVSPIILNTHFEAMSEPIFLTLCFLSLGFLTQYLLNNKNGYFYAAAIASAGAYLTRYVGVTVVVSGMISILVFYHGSWKRRIQKSALFGFIGLASIIAWYLRNYYLTGTFTNRVLVFHPITREKLNHGLLTFLGWLLPDSFPEAIRIIIAILFGLAILYGFLVKQRPEAVNKENDILKWKRLSALLLLYGAVYLLFLFLSLTFFDSSTRIDDRILIPIYFMFILFTVISVSKIVKFSKGRLRSVFLFASFSVSALILGNYFVQSWDLVQRLRQEGRGFSSAAWRSSEIVAEIHRMGPDALVYTNEAFAVYYLTGLGAYSIPEKYDPVVAKVRDDFQSIMEKMRQRLAQPGSALAVFHQGYLREGMPTLEEISAGLVIAHESRDGVIFIDPENISSWEGR